MRIGMVGHAFMGAAHSQAWRTVNRVYDLPRQARMAVVAGRDETRVAAAAARLGWDGHTTDWRTLISRDDIDLIDICTPGDSHAEIAIAALEAGKHVLCEKPLANTIDEARRMADAAAVATGRSMCGFNYRRVPAAGLMRQMVAGGRIGEIRHIRAAYLQDWIADPAAPMVWRLDKEKAGSGALGDIGAHIIDLTQYVTGQLISGVSALTETFVKQRPVTTGGFAQVTVDDAALFLARLDGGAIATYEATRFATGRRNALRVEINGSRGSLAFDFERMNELEFYDATAASTQQGFTRILVTEPDHPYLAGWWPPGHGLGYEHAFTHQARDLIEAIATGGDIAPSFADALQVQLVLDAVLRSADDSSAWTSVTHQPVLSGR
ncbi:Gfo/Idh/MocA family protein [Actinoplanes couchii]|uniref:Oxidoreductase n=1 Tax=Actinoplanes couchii TaxID=403638 RepID=A0ABQ3XDG9_9ACTN|nr:Gfo/Idh/MocA family oxidoreductase [Actinoplanes couchii]MDR6317066.1 putative dehydrogenase [Actinoplanes couchii]GID56561.1 oxidoreductase [Actinoplanes couchii]